MKYLLATTGNEWGRFLHKQSCSTPKKMVSVEIKESHEMKTCEKEVAKELHCASTEVALHSCKNDIEDSKEKSRDARRRMREEFKNIARELNGQNYYDSSTGESMRIESFIPEKKLTLRRPKITVYKNGSKKEEYILGINKIIRKDFSKQIVNKNKWKNATQKGRDTFETLENGHIKVDENPKNRNLNRPNLHRKTKYKHKSYWDKTEKEKTKFKDSDSAQNILDTLRALSGVKYQDCPTNCFEM